MGRPMGRVDCSDTSAFGACECGWRGAPQANRAWARADLANHRRRAHPAQARDAAKKARRRERGVLA